MSFLRQNWIWIAAPIVLFALIILGILLFGPETQAPNGYELR